MATVTLSLRIENRYEDDPSDPIITTVTDKVVEAPPAQDDPTYDDWAYEHVFELTGTGRADGDSWYDVTVTASSDPTLLAVGATFEFGY